MRGIITSSALMAIVMLLLPIAGIASSAAPQNDRCLKCHGNNEITAKQNGRLYIEPNKFDTTSHAVIGCVSCHDKVSAGHPADGNRPAKASCKDCHSQVEQEYTASSHAKNATCTDCHNPHTVKAPSAIAGNDINIMCGRCHESKATIASHAKWLPQAGLHFNSIPCITCHSDSKKHVVTFYIQNKAENKSSVLDDYKFATHDELAKLVSGDKNIKTIIDKNEDNKITLSELRDFNLQLRGKGMRLWGMMTPETVSHDYLSLDDRFDCSYCHAKGTGITQTSFVAMPDNGGGHQRIAVEEGAALDILYGTPDFYTVGSARNIWLNYLGIVIIACGMMMPIGHGTFRFLTRKNRKEH